MDNNLSKNVLLIGLNYVQNLNKYLGTKKKKQIIRQLLKSSQVSLTNLMMLITSWYDEVMT